MPDKNRRIEKLAYKLFKWRSKDQGYDKKDWDLASSLIDLEVNDADISREISKDIEFTRLAEHLDYLDEKIFKFLSLYVQITIAVIGGTVFLSNYQIDSSWALKASNALMELVSVGGIIFILHHLWAWRGYRNELTKFIHKPKTKFWWGSEIVQCLFMAGVCWGFLQFNPMRPEIYGKANGLKSVPVQTRQSPASEVVDKTIEQPLSPASVSSATRVEPSQLNFIRNGLFNYSFSSPESGWGTGLYSDRYSTGFFRQKQYWINFGGANIEASIEVTQKGNALKIVNRSGKQPDVVGVMEQRVDISPGIYVLSFLAKGGFDLEEKALQICTTDDWAIVGPDGKKHGFELTKKGPFDWERFQTQIEIAKVGPSTLSIVSKGAGTVYLTDVTLVKISDSGKSAV